MTIELIKQLMDTCYLAKRARDLLPQEESAYLRSQTKALLNKQSYDVSSPRKMGTSLTAHSLLLPAYQLPLNYNQNGSTHICGHILMEADHIAYQSDDRRNYHIPEDKCSHVPSL